MTRDGPTLWIDDDADPGAWADAIAHTPHLAAQAAACLPDAAPEQDLQAND